jgi:prepilin-type processing-associated H-X9-DG protein
VNNLKQTGLGILNYETSQKRLPPGRYGTDGSTNTCGPYTPDDPTEWKGASGFVMILPYLEDAALYDQAGWDIPPGGVWVESVSSPNWRDAQRSAMIQVRPKVFVCPTSTAEPLFIDTDLWLYNPPRMTVATGSYALCQGHYGPGTVGIPNGTQMKCANTGVFMYGRKIKIREITDGTSKTFGVGEVAFADKLESLNLWTYSSRLISGLRLTANLLNTPPCFPQNLSFCGNSFGTGGVEHNAAFGSHHPGGANFAYVDGHVTFVDDNISLPVYRAASTRDWGEVFTEP